MNVYGRPNAFSNCGSLCYNKIAFFWRLLQPFLITIQRDHDILVILAMALPESISYELFGRLDLFVEKVMRMERIVT
jgi:hypothetical protein